MDYSEMSPCVTNQHIYKHGESFVDRNRKIERENACYLSVLTILPPDTDSRYKTKPMTVKTTKSNARRMPKRHPKK